MCAAACSLSLDPPFLLPCPPPAIPPMQDCELLDLAGRPEDLLVTNLPVPPVCIRPRHARTTGTLLGLAPACPSCKLICPPALRACLPTCPAGALCVRCVQRGDGCGCWQQRGRHHHEADAGGGGEQHTETGGRGGWVGVGARDGWLAMGWVGVGLVAEHVMRWGEGRPVGSSVAPARCSRAQPTRLAPPPPSLLVCSHRHPAARCHCHPPLPPPPTCPAGPGEGPAHREPHGELGLPADPVRHVHQQRPAGAVGHVQPAGQAHEVGAGVGRAWGVGVGMGVGGCTRGKGWVAWRRLKEFPGSLNSGQRGSEGQRQQLRQDLQQKADPRPPPPPPPARRLQGLCAAAQGQAGAVPRQPERQAGRLLGAHSHLARPKPEGGRGGVVVVVVAVCGPCVSGCWRWLVARMPWSSGAAQGAPEPGPAAVCGHVRGGGSAGCPVPDSVPRLARRPPALALPASRCACPS